MNFCTTSYLSYRNVSLALQAFLSSFEIEKFQRLHFLECLLQMKRSQQCLKGIFLEVYKCHLKVNDLNISMFSNQTHTKPQLQPIPCNFLIMPPTFFT